MPEALRLPQSQYWQHQVVYRHVDNEFTTSNAGLCFGLCGRPSAFTLTKRDTNHFRPLFSVSLDSSYQMRDDLSEISNQSEVANLKNRGLRILIDGHYHPL